jgi:Zn-dependent protease/predicted transcriptional regulator
MDATTSHGRLQIARVLGIPVYVHFSWLVIFGLLTWTLATGYFPAASPDLPVASYWAKGLVASLLFFLSILLHEMGHSWVALRHGIRIRSITLFIFGGVAHMEKDADDGRTEVKIAIAGPIVSFALAGSFVALAALPPLPPSARAVAHYLGTVNFILAVFNLVPAFPLDGGRVLRGLLWRTQGKVRATRTAAGAGTFFALLLIVVGVMSFLGGNGIGGMWYVLIGWFLKDASAGAYAGARLDETLRGLTVRDAMTSDVATLPAHVSVSEAAHEYFMNTGYGGYPVVRGDAVVGMLSLRDVLRLAPEERERTAVQAVMAPLGDSVVVGPDEPLRAAMSKMAERGAGRLLVMQNGQLIGILTMSAVVRHVRVREELAA